MARIIFVALLVVVAACAVIATTLPPQPCRENEEWRECGNACIEPKCGQEPASCGQWYCEARCQCSQGYCRNKYNNCVPINSY